MTEKLPATSYIVSMGFLYGVAAAAVLIMGLGIVTVVAVNENPFEPLVQGPALTAAIIAMVLLIGALILAGLRRDNRLRWTRIAGITGGVLLAYFAGYVIVSILTSGSDGLLVALSALFLFVSPATLVIVVATVAATWAYFGSLRWQARNGETKQYLAPDN
nr:MAG: hypothetical protein GM42_1935 [actinobacterium acMicro-1]